MAEDQDYPSGAEFYLTVAAFFETVIRDEAGVLTLVRMVDRFIVPKGESPDAFAQIPIIDTHLVVSFRGVAGPRAATLTIQPRTPSDERLPRQDLPIFIEEGSTGFNANVSIQMHAEQEGIYWFDLLLDDRFISRTPLEVVFAHVWNESTQTDSGGRS